MVSASHVEHFLKKCTVVGMLLLFKRAITHLPGSICTIENVWSHVSCGIFGLGNAF